MGCRIRINVQLSNSLQNISSGPIWMRTFENGSLRAWSVNSVKFTGTLSLLLVPSTILAHGFHTYTLTWSDQCQCVRITNIYWRWWTASHDGPPQSQSRTSQQTPLPRPSWKNGSVRLVHLKSSRRIEEHNSNHLSFRNSQTFPASNTQKL